MEASRRPQPLEPMPGNGGSMATVGIDPDQFSRQLLLAILAFRDGEFGVRRLRGHDGGAPNRRDDIDHTAGNRHGSDAKASGAPGPHPDGMRRVRKAPTCRSVPALTLFG